MRIAEYTGIGSSSGNIFFHEIIDNIIPKLFPDINNIMGKNIEPIFKESTSKPYDFITDISKAKKQLGFNPKISIKEGIEKTIKNYIKNKW